MKSFCIGNYYRKLLKKRNLRTYSTSVDAQKNDRIVNIRNIGILAHIDAG